MREVTLTREAWEALEDGRLSHVRLDNAPPVLGEVVRLRSESGALTLRRVVFAEEGVASLDLARGTPEMRHVLGVDPGLASLGFACVSIEPASGAERLVDLDVIETKPDRTLSKTADDGRRWGILHAELERRIRHYGPSALGFETYTVFDSNNEQDIRLAGDRLVAALAGVRSASQLGPVLSEPAAASRFLDALTALREATGRVHTTRGRGAAAKVLGVVGIVYALAARFHLPVYAWTPSQGKRALLGKASGSKAEVESFLRERLGAPPRKIPASKANHAYDACMFAHLAAKEISREILQNVG